MYIHYNFLVSLSDQEPETLPASSRQGPLPASSMEKTGENRDTIGEHSESHKDLMVDTTGQPREAEGDSIVNEVETKEHGKADMVDRTKTGEHSEGDRDTMAPTTAVTTSMEERGKVYIRMYM